MAHFAKIGLNNKVITVNSVHNNELKDSNGVEQEVNGIDFLTKLTGWAVWKQTSYNTHGGIHTLGGTPFRKNKIIMDYGTHKQNLDYIRLYEVASTFDLYFRWCLVIVFMSVTTYLLLV